MGFFSYFRRYVKDFSKIAQPMNQLLAKDTPFLWTNECQLAFETLKLNLIENATLKLPDFDKTFHLETDSSGFAVGGVLSQLDGKFPRPVAYFSKQLTKVESRRSTTHREILAIFHALKHFQVYLRDRSFTLTTDHSAILQFHKLTDSTGQMMRLLMFIQGFDFTIHYKAGSKLIPSDTLSRMPFYETITGVGTDAQTQTDSVTPPVTSIASTNVIDSVVHRQSDTSAKLLLDVHSTKQPIIFDSTMQDPSSSNGGQAQASDDIMHATIASALLDVPVTPQPIKDEYVVPDRVTLNGTRGQASEDSTQVLDRGYIEQIAEVDSESRVYNLIYQRDTVNIPEHQNAHINTARAGYAINELQIPEHTEILKLLKQDPFFSALINYLDKSELPLNNMLARKISLQATEYLLNEDVLYHLHTPRGQHVKNKDPILQVVIPKQLRHEILENCHDSVIAGHFGLAKTYGLVRERFYWPTLFKDLSIYIKTCHKCQQAKLPNHRIHKNYLTPIPCKSIFSRVSMDIAGPLPESKEGFKYVLCITDSFTKWPETFALRSTTAIEVANKFFYEYICRYGSPTSILSDCGQSFMALVIKELCLIFQIVKLKTASWSPTTNGQTERYFRHLKAQLKIYCGDDQTSWPSKLAPLTYAYRASINHTTGYSPYYAVFSRPMSLPVDILYTPNAKLKQEGA
jgi:hypothetical protein